MASPARKATSNWGALREGRVGVMLHYDGSASDAGALAWLRHDARARVSYTDLVMDDGRVEAIAPRDARAWHAGACRPSSPLLRYADANSAFYGLAFAARPGDTLTDAAVEAALQTVRAYYAREGWNVRETWRITDHASEAWPRGRKSDLAGRGPDGSVVAGLTWAGDPFTLDRFLSLWWISCR